MSASEQKYSGLVVPCEGTMDTTTRMRQHNRDSKFCEKCHEKFPTMNALKTHKRLCVGEMLVKKEECGESFSPDTGLDKNQKMNAGKKQCSYPYSCPKCPASFAHRFNLTYHLRIHSGEKPFVCEECGRAFRGKSGLVSHRWTHVDEKPHACPECPLSFSARRLLKVHTRTHSRERPFACEECGKAFRLQSALILHRRIHTGEKPYACEDCGKAFRTSSNLRVHRETHSLKRPYSCPECPSRFIQKISFEKHMRVHIREKIFVCETFGETSRGQQDFTLHRTIPTDEQYGGTFKPKTLFFSHRSTHIEVIPYLCEECGKGFLELSHLISHSHSS